MKAIAFASATARLIGAACLVCMSASAQQRDYPVKPVPFTAVHVTDNFWAPKIETNRAVTIPFAFKQDEDTGRINNFVRAAEALHGVPFEDHRPPGYPFDDTDIYKVIEGASYTLSVHPDPKLDAYLDDLIAKIAAAQEPDGYLYTARTIDPAHPHPWSGNERWVLEGVNSHELYDLGHLYEAAVAHYQATGKRTLLDIALRTANLLDRTFGPGKREIWPGHQIVEMGLAKLYRVTGEERYLNLAKFMLDVRGPQSKEQGAGNRYVEADRRVVDQDTAVTGGHAVRAMYMYSGMADVAALTGDTSYVNALDKIWDNVASRKLHVTGGVGARAAGEAFGADYELPNMSAYNETCAAVGNDYWNQRLFLLHADAKYIDVMERTLYNGLISGVSLDGTTFFYENPLEATGKAAKDQRRPWFGVACCPGNITRFMASVPGYVYAQRGDALWVNLYMANNAEIKMDNGRTVKMAQATKYPWDGDVKMTVTPDQAARMTINVRIPGWARNQPIASDLYRFTDDSKERVAIKVNGAAVPITVDKGYVAITRTWKSGDTIELNLPMPVRRVIANDNVVADRGRVAIERGPIMYAAEWVDNPNGKVRNLMLPDSSVLTAEYKPDLLKGVTIVKGKAIALASDKDGKVVKTEQAFTAIPYYAWANRGRGEMIVWLPTSEASAKPTPFPTLISSAKVTASLPPQGGNTALGYLQDGEEPSSTDPGTHFDWWPAKGQTVWVQYDFEKPATVSQSQVFWFDDTGRGECKVPASWRLLYKDGDEWKPVDTQARYTVERGAYNQVGFKAVTTSAIRLELTMQPNWSAGVHKWHIE
ncbi:MAG TPA: beta-L-arabinofuranosidase domain-containing protein [Verrucomicrobiae bacterium]|nr:beta-L-arabinofuranosidase domain-containing protein [Verrucomicrobiae bacterium]